jgi:hypothetical protein
MFKYLLVDQAVPAMCRSLAAARLRADCPSGNAPTTRARRLSLAQDALEGVIGTNTPPVLLREGVVGQRLIDCRFHDLGGLDQA